MKNIIIFGYGMEGVSLYRKLKNHKEYRIIGFADNSIHKQGMKVDNLLIYSVNELVELKKKQDFSVVIAARAWYQVGAQLEENNISIEGIYVDGELEAYYRMTFDKLDLTKGVKLYAGDICDEVHMQDECLYGLSINRADKRHILHDITIEYPLPDNSIEGYQAEDVLEHITINKLVPAINEIYRILKPGGCFRICLPDYFSPYLKSISMKDNAGNIVFDPTGGGTYGVNGVENGGHVWFPTYKNISEILGETLFNKIDFLCYYTENEELVKGELDFSKGYIRRVPTDEVNGIYYSIVIDCYK